MRLAGVVLAAGTGRRLAPLTDCVPKPLLPILDRSLLRHQIERLQEAGARRIFVNAHHHADAVARHLERNAPGAICRLESRLTGPAGALSLFAEELDAYDAVLVASSDVLLGAGLRPLLAAHVRDDAVFTFGVVETTGARRFGVLDLDAAGVVHGAEEKPAVPDHESHPVSAGVYCLRPAAVEEVVRLAQRSASVDFARDLAPALLARGERVTGHRLGGYWRDVGTPSSYREANRDALAGEIPSLAAPLSGQSDPGWVAPTYVHPAARVGAGVRIEGPAVVGAGAELGAGAGLVDAVVLPGAVVPEGTLVHGGIVAPVSAPSHGRPALVLDEVGAR
jgi:NDP-sugar pyrophosphorylase family protein